MSDFHDKMDAAIDGLDERLTNIETDLRDARDHYGDAFAEVGLRLDTLEEWKNGVNLDLDILERKMDEFVVGVGEGLDELAKGMSKLYGFQQVLDELLRDVAYSRHCKDKHKAYLANIPAEPQPPQPPAICEGCAEIDDCKDVHDATNCPVCQEIVGKPICYVEKAVETRPASCEGCADFWSMCDKWVHGAIEDGKLDCYVEKKTCGTCRKAYWSACDSWLGGCRLYSADEPWHPIQRGYPACSNHKPLKVSE